MALQLSGFNTGKFWRDLEEKIASYAICNDLIIAEGVYFDKDSVDHRTGCTKDVTNDIASVCSDASFQPSGALGQDFQVGRAFSSVEEYFSDNTKPTWPGNVDPFKSDGEPFSFTPMSAVYPAKEPASAKSLLDGEARSSVFAAFNPKVYTALPPRKTKPVVGSRAWFESQRQTWGRTQFGDRVSHPWDGGYLESGYLVPTHFWVAVCDPKRKVSVGFFIKNFMHQRLSTSSQASPGFKYMRNVDPSGITLQELAYRLGGESPNSVEKEQDPYYLNYFFPVEMCETGKASDFLDG
jgi:hypothetical protein